MKTRFSGLDLACQIRELQKLVGMRINKIYDIDKKTYLFRFQRTEEKSVLLIESGSRIHETNSAWPKNDAPSGFTMKLRKHLKNKRLEEIFQLKSDRVAVLQFGTNEFTNYVIVELYDRGNLILTDHEHVILGVLRPRLNVGGDENNKITVRETYEVTNEKVVKMVPLSNEEISQLVANASPNDNLKKLLVPLTAYGPALLEHLLLAHGIPLNKKKKDFDSGENIEAVISSVLQEANDFLNNHQAKGFILQKVENVSTGQLVTNTEFHPFKFRQHAEQSSRDFDTFNAAVDEFFSQMESQKIDMKVAQQEKQALKKLENIKKDHENRLQTLEEEQAQDRLRGELIELNSDLVDKALNIIRTAIANQMDWKDIEEIVSEAGENGDPILSRIRKLKLDINHFTMMLSNPFDCPSSSSSSEDEESGEPSQHEVELDIDMTANQNARTYYDKKKSAARKTQKTLQSHSTAIKSAEKKTKAALREVAVSANIVKIRKTFWFEKFYWFISSENYLVIAGRDGQQNELLVKRYMASTDIYVHADLHGASSVVIKNPSGKPVPPKTLNEAGHMAVCYSAAWENKVVTSAYWVEANQVSKSAPTGEYLTTGSFMIRGKKNYLPPSHLILGFGILFKLGDESLEAHKNERRVRTLQEDEEANADQVAIHNEEAAEEDVELQIEDDIELEAVKEELETVEEAQEFPDTTLAMNFSSAKGLEFKAVEAASSNFPSDSTAVCFTDSKTDGKREDEDEASGGQRPSFSKEKKSKKKQASSKADDDGKQIRVDNDEDSGDEMSGAAKAGNNNVRGKNKQKKIRQKYKDQDQEEKELRMQLLHQAQKEDGKRAKKKKKEQQMKAEKENKLARQKAMQQGHNQRTFQQTSTMHDDDDQDAAVKVSDEVDMIDALTGIPLVDDELLYAMVMIGPYNALTNFKHKVKVTPGTAKRGKAAKTTLSVFMADRAASSREKDLLKSLKDQDVSRNLPGKVKISAPQMLKSKAKKVSSS